MRKVRKITANKAAGGSGIIAVFKDGVFMDVKDAGIKPGKYKAEVMPDGTLKISPKKPNT